MLKAFWSGKLWEAFFIGGIKRKMLENTMLKKYRHIIWDWNGTLFDDIEVCVDILNGMLGRRCMGLISCRDYREKFDFPVQDFYRRIGFDFSDESFDIVANEFMDEYNHKRFECSLYDGAFEVLNGCINAGFGQSILSAYHQKRLEEIVEFFGIGELFVGMVGLDDYYAACKIANGKRLVKDLGVDRSEILLVGDTTHDFEVAKAIEADCVLVSGGHQTKERLQQCQTQVFDSISEVLSLLS